MQNIAKIYKKLVKMTFIVHIFVYFAHTMLQEGCMKNIITSGLVGIGIGMLIGGIIVSKNKRLATQIDKGTDKLAEGAKEFAKDAEMKIKKSKQKNTKTSKKQ